MPPVQEIDRRLPGASGLPLRLADGSAWLLARPAFLAGGRPLTRPDVDDAIDRIHEHMTLGEEIPLVTIWDAAARLMRANYRLDPDELADLLELAPGDEAEAFATAVLDALFGPEDRARSYQDWVRASLLANGLGSCAIGGDELNDVLATLVATGRAVRPERFVDVCRAAEERSSLEQLVR